MKNGILIGHSPCGVLYRHKPATNCGSLLKSVFFISIALIFLSPQHSNATTIFAKVSARIIPALAATAVTPLNFGDLSSGNTAGEITIPANGAHRSSTGGVSLRNSDSGSPATIRLVGARNMSYSVKLPKSIHLIDEHGHSMVVDGFNTSANAGHLDGRGIQEFSIGGHLQVPANQGVGSYSGVLPVEVNYN